MSIPSASHSRPASHAPPIFCGGSVRGRREIHLQVFFDGAAPGQGSLGPPKHGGSGYIVFQVLPGGGKRLLAEGSYRLPKGSTNNQTEFHAALTGVQVALSLLVGADLASCPISVEIKGDSSLVVDNMNDVSIVRASSLKALSLRLKQAVLRLRTRCLSVKFSHIFREFNSDAD